MADNKIISKLGNGSLKVSIPIVVFLAALGGLYWRHEVHLNDLEILLRELRTNTQAQLELIKANAAQEAALSILKDENQAASLQQIKEGLDSIKTLLTQPR